MKAALLVIDVQKAFFQDNPAAAAPLRDAAEYINVAIKLFRDKKLPIICIQHMNPEDNVVPGQDGFDLPDILNILPTDPHIHKTYSNAFNKTPLAGMLSKEGIDTVVITGFAAEGCVTATCRGARDLDLTAIILRGSIIGGKQEFVPFVEATHDIISYRALAKVLE
jgi:nicotinamidase-related amidase